MNVTTEGDDAIAEIPFEQCLDLRHAVLHPRKSRDFSRVEGDDKATHLGLVHNGEFVACLSVFGSYPAQIRKLATLEKYQGHGFGTKLMLGALKRLETAPLAVTDPGSTSHSISPPSVFLDARTTAIGFYKRFGFEQVGNTFFKGEIEHVRMER